MKFDVIVVGGGHAGCEAALASAKLGLKTGLVTMNPSRIGFMSCNPAMGGLAKGQLIKEIDALGGRMGINTDLTAIQYRRLNSSKGPAVRSSRAQCDKALYAAEMQKHVETIANLTVLPVEASEILVEHGEVVGFKAASGEKFECRSLVLTTGTFLAAVMHTGFEQTSGGRLGDQAASTLSQSIRSLGFPLGRLKTGTPPRLHRDSIDYSKVEAQPGDAKPVPFSFYYEEKRFPRLPQVNCFITYSNEKTHEIIEQNFDRSPMFTGVIQGVGPRYCPSIEDKVKRFRERNQHQIFLEPEGLESDEIYVNGISTSLPRDVQEAFVHSIVGLEQAKFVRHGYAVEYDCVQARQLKATLESKDVPGLFFAGQINGTSGYEEAGAQGLIAGINAGLRVLSRDPFVMSRLDGYIGVLIDDLILKGADEPYRMFTSRAEYRLLLREDNADLRLSEKARNLGLLGDREWEIFCQRRDSIDEGRKRLASHYYYPTEAVNQWFASHNLTGIKDRTGADVLLRRPEISWNQLCDLGFEGTGYEESVREQLEIQIKYEGYIRRDMETLEGVRKSEYTSIPANLDFEVIPGLSSEVRSRLKNIRPETLGQASRLQGITPAAVATLMIYLKMNSKKSVNTAARLDG